MDEKKLEEGPWSPQQREVLSVYEHIRAERQPYEIEVLRKRLIVLLNVFSPKYFTDSEYFAAEVPNLVRDGSFLEIGTGTGLIACHVAENGSRRTVATDINPDACRNALLNAQGRSLSIEVREGNMFEPVKGETFDSIFWNHPFNYSEQPVRDILLRAGFDHKYEGLEEYFRGGKEHLTHSGKLLLGTSDIARLDIIEEFARRYGYAMHIRSQKKVPIEHGGEKDYELFIIEFSPIKSSN